MTELLEKFPIGERIISEKSQKDFIKLYSGILRLKNILESFDEFENKKILSERDIQDYHSMYIELYNEFRKEKNQEKQEINDDLIFEMELIKQVEINIDYILELIKKYHEDHIGNKEILADINRAISSSVELRNKKDLIEQFIQNLDVFSSVDSDWIEFVEKKKNKELQKIIIEENLDPQKTVQFVEKSFKNGYIETTGTEVAEILPKISFFG